MAVRSHKLPIAKTTTGSVRGYFSDAVYVFKGIPYGGPVCGTARFRPAIPPVAWGGLKDATRFGPAAPQLPLPDRTTMAQAMQASPWSLVSELAFAAAIEPYQDENCLVLNIWTPGLNDGARRPVLVRIHGGGFYSGSGAWSWHDGTHLAQRGDAVIVTVNHRLNAFGFLYLGEAMGKAFDFGNVGLTDLVLALKWICANIAEFGGDPANVTIFGESGGGMKISALLTMKEGQGLFRRAIIQSGALPRVKTMAEACEETRRFLGLAGVDIGDIDALQALEVGAILDAQAAAGINPLPYIDNRTILQHPMDALADGVASNIPLILGTTLTEGTTVHLPHMSELMQIDERTLLDRVSRVYDPIVAGRLIKAYKASFAVATPGELFLLIESASWMRREMWEFADAKLRSDPRVFIYLMAWKSGAADGMMMAAHGLCVPLSMDNVERSGPWTADFPESQEVADAMSEAWLAFARDGLPNVPGGPEWPAYDDNGRRSTMVFDTVSRVVDDPYHERDIWRNVPLPVLIPSLVWAGLVPC